jgi:hypothetical protein
MASLQTLDLEAELKLANNGYLVNPNKAMRDAAEANPDAYVSVNGLIYRKGQPPQQYARAPRAPQILVDGADYEAAILDRQATDGLYD